MWTFSLIAFLLFFFNADLFAFINIESIRQIKGEGFIGRSSLQGNGQSGNTEKFTSLFSTIGADRKHDNEWLYLANYKYGTSFKIKDTNLGNLHLRHTWKYKEKQAYEFFAQAEFNEFRKLNSRRYVGANLRHRLFKNETNNLFLGLGSFYEIEDFVGKQSDQDHLRANLYLSYLHTYNSKISTFVSSYYQPLFNHVDNYRWRLHTGVDIKISDSLGVTINYNINHDTGLPPNVLQTDTDYLVGLTLAY